MPIKDYQKIQHFANEATARANEIAAKINAEVDEREAGIIAQQTEKFNAEADAYIDREIKGIKRENSRTLSTTSMETGREYLLYREKITQKVFDMAREKLICFSESEKYGEYLVRLCAKALAGHSGSFTIFLAEKDLKYKYDILEELDRLIEKMLDSGSAMPVYSVTPDKSIKIGGAKFRSSSGDIMINASLDDGLLQNREYFSELLSKAENEEVSHGEQ